MSGLQEFLAPFSHLLFANRNLVIVVLCFVAGGVAMIALMDRWRADRLERDLSAAKSNASIAPLGRRYANAGPGEAAPVENGPLPAVKGGRTYARNLGTALQKAGMAGPQIYSPPTPTGFAPQNNPMQPGPGHPGQPAPYATPNVPWASPTPPATPWGFPGAGRNAPAPAPFYQAPAPGAPQPLPLGTPPQPQPAFGGPGMYAPSSAPAGLPAPQAAPFAPPGFPPANQASAAPPTAPAPPLTPPVPGPPMTPPLPMPPAMQPPSPPETGDGSRRGKPKRRRFNFNVLENLEKMVQSRPAEPAAPPAQAPAAPPIASGPSASPVGVPMAPPAAVVPPAPAAPIVPVPLAAVAPVTVPAPESAPPAEPVEAPTLPFFFGKREETKSGKPVEVAAPSAPPSAPEPEPATSEELEASTIEPEPVTAAPSSEPAATFEEAPAPPEETDDSRRSMRSMMFGEEIVSAAAPAEQEEATAPATAEPEASASAEEQPETAESADEPAVETGSEAEPAWPSYWSRREQASSSAEEADAATAAPAAEPTPEPVEDETPAVHGKPFGSYNPWKPVEPEPSVETEETWKTEPAPETEPVAEAAPQEEPVAMAEPAQDEVPPTPVADVGEKPSAGTVVIIEDDQTAASYYATLFSGNGYRVEVANDGVSGVDVCARVQPQVILLDVMMPRQNGILVLQTLRASDETKNTPVVVMSNFSEPTLIKRAIQLGALEYVIKTQVEGPALLNAMPRWMNREKAFSAA